jgi:hypothetical protein
MFRVQTASSGKRSEGTAGSRSTISREWRSCRLASRYLARKRGYSLGPIRKDLSRQFQWRSMLSFEDLWVKPFWSLLGAYSRRGMEPHGLRDRPSRDCEQHRTDPLEICGQKHFGTHGDNAHFGRFPKQGHRVEGPIAMIDPQQVRRSSKL